MFCHISLIPFSGTYGLGQVVLRSTVLGDIRT